jgi:hypothetical protein
MILRGAASRRYLYGERDTCSWSKSRARSVLYSRPPNLPILITALPRRGIQCRVERRIISSITRLSDRGAGIIHGTMRVRSSRQSYIILIVSTIQTASQLTEISEWAHGNHPHTQKESKQSVYVTVAWLGHRPKRAIVLLSFPYQPSEWQAGSTCFQSVHQATNHRREEESATLFRHCHGKTKAALGRQALGTWVLVGVCFMCFSGNNH